MPFFTKHSAPAVRTVDSPTDPKSSKRPKVHIFSLKQFRVKNEKNCHKNKSKLSIFRFSKLKCKKENSAVVEDRLLQQEAMPTKTLAESVLIQNDRCYSSQPALDTSLYDSCQDEESCVCLLEDSYHPDKVHKKHWYTIKRTQSCNIDCSKEDDKGCRRTRKHRKESFTPLSRKFRRFLHLNSDDGIHYFFESRDCECYNSTESFESIFGHNNTVGQTCDRESSTLSIFSTPPTSIAGEICSSDNCCSTDTTLIVVNKVDNCCISLPSVFDCKQKDCSTAVPALACEGHDCSSPANVVLAREEPQRDCSNSISNAEQSCATAVNLILSCGAQECSTVNSAPTYETEPCSSVDLVLGCELTECGPVCQAIDRTSHESGNKSTLVLFENRPSLCSANASVLSCIGVDCAQESVVIMNKGNPWCSTDTNSRIEDKDACALFVLNSEGFAPTGVSRPCRGLKSLSAISPNKELDDNNQQSNKHESDNFEHKRISSLEPNSGSLVSGFPTSSVKCSLSITKLFQHISEECF